MYIKDVAATVACASLQTFGALLRWDCINAGHRKKTENCRDVPDRSRLTSHPRADWRESPAFSSAADGGTGETETCWRKADFELVWGFSCQVVVFGLLAVLCSEVCPGKASMFSRRQSCRGKSQSPVVRIAEEMETEPSKPIDKISRGENTSHRAVSKENALWPRKK